MSKTITFTIDGVEVQAEPGQTIMQAAHEAGIYIPHLCHHKELTPFGACRVCTCMVNGRPQSACTQPAGEGAVVENDTDELNAMRCDIIEMLFVEGNHYCMFCQASGSCLLQAVAYRLKMMAPKYPYQFPKRCIDASHPTVMIDRNRCILCARCVRSSQELDGKHVFQFVGRGGKKRIAVNADALAQTDAEVTDRAVDLCPVGAIIKKRQAYGVPIGRREFDNQPVGTETEAPAE